MRESKNISETIYVIVQRLVKRNGKQVRITGTENVRRVVQI